MSSVKLSSGAISSIAPGATICAVSCLGVCSTSVVGLTVEYNPESKKVKCEKNGNEVKWICRDVK